MATERWRTASNPPSSSNSAAAATNAWRRLSPQPGGQSSRSRAVRPAPSAIGDLHQFLERARHSVVPRHPLIAARLTCWHRDEMTAPVQSGLVGERRSLGGLLTGSISKNTRQSGSRLQLIAIFSKKKNSWVSYEPRHVLTPSSNWGQSWWCKAYAI